MKIKYESVTGEVTQVEVSDEIGSIIIESRKAEHAQDERQRYHCPYSTNALLFEGLEYGTKEPEEDMPDEVKDRIRHAFSKLTAIQRRRLSLYADGMSLEAIAAKEGVAYKAVWDSIQQARKKFLKNF